MDTAGLRRKRRQRQGIEYYSELRAIQAAERADVALVLIDSSEGMVDQDLRVADVARTAGCSTLVSSPSGTSRRSTWRTSGRVLEERLRQRPPLVAVSANRAAGSTASLDKIAELFSRHTARIPTPELNNFLQELRAAAARADQAGQGPPAEPPLRHADRGSPAAFKHLRQRSRLS